VALDKVIVQWITFLHYTPFFLLLKRKKKKLYRTFIDFEKPFDQMWRDSLWYKLLLNNINGKMFQIIQYM